MVSKLYNIKEAFELALKDTAEVKVITVASGISEGSKAYLMNYEADQDELDCDADGTWVGSILKKGETSTTGTACAQSGAIPGTSRACRRSAANVFEMTPTGKFTQYRKGEIQLPIIDGQCKVTLCQDQTGATATKAQVYYNFSVIVDSN